MVLLIALILWLLPIWAHATTYYVATTGSNSNNGTSESTPFLTVAYCVSTMVAGDTCLVMAGDYSEGLIRFGRTGTQTAPIRLAAYPGASKPKITFIAPEGANFDRILIQNTAGSNVAMGWITIEGFELTNGHEGIKYYNLHNSTFRNNWIHHNGYQGILGNDGGHHNLFEKNIFNHNGRFAACAAGTTTLCIQDHGIYAHGKSYVIRNNLFYDNIGYGVQQNGSSTAVYSSSKHAGTEFAGAQDWIVTDNTFAYQYNRGGMVIWGSLCTNVRIENNIFYENNVTNRNAAAQGVEFLGTSTGVQIRNNHFYASGSGNTAQYSGTQPGDLVSTGNVVNVSAPAFVNGGSNALPASPDFRLTASAPVNIARVNEYTNNSTLVVGAYKTVGTPTASMTTNKITVTLPMSSAVPVQNLSTTGVSFSCTSNVCPGSPVVSSVSRVTATDSQVEIVLSGITSNACLAHADAITVSYSSSTGSWTGNDNIGPSPGSHQKILSFTNVAVTNNCTGSGPTGPSASYISYTMNDGAGTTVTDSGGGGLHGTLVNGASWATGKTGTGVSVAGGTTQQMTIPYGNAINPTTQDMTWVVPVNVATGQTNAVNFVFGTETGADQRGYIVARDGTWRVGRQAITSVTAGASNLAVVEGWNYLVARWNSTTDTVTLCNNGVTGTGGATGSYTSFTFPTNFEAPILGTNFPSTVTQTLYDDVQIFTSLQDCATLYAAWNAPPVAAVAFSQTAVQFEEIYTSGVGGTVLVLPSPNNTRKVVQGGAVAIVAQVECNNCPSSSFRLASRDNGVGNWVQVSNVETTDNVSMWGTSTPQYINNGALSTRVLANGCTTVAGTTQTTLEQIPALTLPASGCTMLRYLVRIRAGASGYTEFRIEQEGGVAFTGSYVLGRIDVTSQSAGGVGF